MPKFDATKRKKKKRTKKKPTTEEKPVDEPAADSPQKENEEDSNQPIAAKSEEEDHTYEEVRISSHFLFISCFDFLP